MVEAAELKKLEEREDVVVDQNSGTVYRITGYRNANKYPMSIRTAAWALTIDPDSYVLDRNGNKVTTKKLMSYVGPGQLSVDREVVKSIDNFLRDVEEPVQNQEIGVKVAGKAAPKESVVEPVEADVEASDETAQPETQPDDKPKAGLKFNKMK